MARLLAESRQPELIELGIGTRRTAAPEGCGAPPDPK